MIPTGSNLIETMNKNWKNTLDFIISSPTSDLKLKSQYLICIHAQLIKIIHPGDRAGT